MEKGKYWLSSFLLLVVLTSSIYFVLDDNLRIDIQDTKSIFKVQIDGKWIISGIEYVNLFDGTAKMRASERNINVEIFENDTIVTRTAQYKNNILVVETYIFQSNTNDITLFPVSHDIMVIGAYRPDRPYILQYEVQKLLYTGETINEVESPQKFGYQMKVEWEDGNYYSRIFKYKDKDEGKLTIKYRIDSDRFGKNVRLFDPPGQNLTIPFGDTQSLGGDLVYDNVFIYGTLNVNGTDYLNITADYIFINGTIDGTGAITPGGIGADEGGFGGTNGGIGSGLRPGTGGEGGYTSTGPGYSCAAGAGGAGGAAAGISGPFVDHVVDCDGGIGGAKIGTVDNNIDKTVWFGSTGGGGGAGSSQSSDADGGDGGLGSGWLSIRAKDVDISGNIIFYGDDGQAGAGTSTSYSVAGGGGGGSGGTVLIVAINLNISNSLISVSGGTGGACYGASGDCSGALGDASDGGNGGGGRIKLFSVFLENDSTTITTGTGSFHYGEENDFDVLLLSPQQDDLISNPVNFTCQSLSGENLTLNIDEVQNITVGGGLLTVEYNISDGEHNYSCNTSTFNPYTIDFVVDISPPTIEALTPVDNFVSDINNNIFTINMTDTQATLDGVDLWTNEDGTWALRETNTSASGLTNANVTFNRYVSVESLLWSMYYCDNLSNCEFTENRTLIIDRTNPIVSTIYPQNISYIINVSDLNYIVFDDYPNRCWYSLNEGVTNSTSVASGTNFTGVVSQIGSNIATVYCNDTRGNVGSDSITYTLDAIRYSTNSDSTNTSTTGVGGVFINVTVNPVLDRQNISFIGYNLTSGIISQYLSNDFTNYTNYTTLISTTNPFYWDVILYDTNNISYTLDIRYRGIEEINFSTNGTFGNIIAELGSDIYINATSNISYVYIDVNHPSYGNNVASGFLETSLNLIINWFRAILFADQLKYQILNFTFGFDTSEIKVFNLTANQYDEVVNVSINITGINNPFQVTIYKANSSDADRVFVGNLTSSGYVQQDRLFDRTTVPAGYNQSQIISFDNRGEKLIYFILDSSAKLIHFTLDIVSTAYGFSFFDSFDNDSYIDTVLSNSTVFGGRVMPLGASPLNFSYDDCEDSSINDTLWDYPTDYHFNVPSGSGFDVDATTSEALGSINNDVLLSLSGGCGVDDVSVSNTRYLATNPSYLDLSTVDNIYFEIYFDYDNREESTGTGVNNRQCQAVFSSFFGGVNIWSIDSNNYNCEYNVGGSCHSLGRVNENISVSLSKQLNGSWKVELFGIEYHYSTSSVDSCGDYEIYLNWTEGKKYSNYDSCASTVTDITREFYITPNYNTLQPLYFSNYGSSLFEEGPGCNGCTDVDNNFKVYYVNDTRRSFENSTIVSKSVFNSAVGITSVTLNAIGEGLYIFDISTNNGDNWQNILPGVDTPILYPGVNVKWRAHTNVGEGGYLFEVPYIDSISIETEEGNVSNLTFDFGNDGTIDYEINGEVSFTNGTLEVNLKASDISDAFIGTPIFGKSYLVPLAINSDSTGSLLIESINLIYNPNPIYLNISYIQGYLNNYGNEQTIIPMTIQASGNNSIVNITDLRFDYAGGNNTIEIITHNEDYSQSLSRNITYYYSRWDYKWVPKGVEWIYFAPTSPTKQNVTPYGQSNDVPIINITNYGYGGKNATLSILQDDSLSCVSTTISLDNNKSNGYLLTENWTELINLTYLETTDIYLWADYSCNYSTWRNFQPNYYFRQCVEGGICSTDLI